jgi:hypothetical protein
MKRIFLGLALLVSIMVFSCRAHDHSHPNENTPETEETKEIKEPTEGHAASEMPLQKDTLNKTDSASVHH